MTAMTEPQRIQKSTLTVSQIYNQVLDGIPTDGPIDILDGLIQLQLNAAEDRVERELDIMISERMVYCIDNPGFEPPEFDAEVCAPIDIPSNWLAGNRAGALKLPKNVPKIIHAYTVRSFFGSRQKFQIPVTPQAQSAVTLTKNLMRFKSPWLAGSSGSGLMGAFGGGVSSNGMGSNMGFGSGGVWRQQAGVTLAGAAEVVYTGGLSRRELTQNYAMILSLIMMATQIGVMTAIQFRIGGGTQKEMIQYDATANTVEYSRRDANGPLGGEIKALQRLYDLEMNALRAGKLRFMMLA